jgi:hypothetical protein
MNAAIKNLETIGQNSSLKQHDSLNEMLEKLDLKTDSIKDLYKEEFVCALIPEDDDDKEEE